MIKEPDREPDYISKNKNKYYFNEMIVAHNDGDRNHLRENNDGFLHEFGMTMLFNEEIQVAYRDWLVEHILLGDSDE